MGNKLDHLNYRWYVIRTHYQKMDQLVELFEKYKVENKNILEIYVPNRTTVRVWRNGVEQRLQLFLGIAFVLATQSALMEFLRKYSLDFRMQYDSTKGRGEDKTARFCVIPEEEKREFRNYNENYADKVVILERPYTDYAFNIKANEPNELVRVIDGPLAGCEGYICRFKRNRGLVFHVQDATPGNHLTVVYPNVYDLHVVRIHNAEGDRLSIDTEKARATDLIIGMLQACGYGARTLQKFYEIIEILSSKLSLVELYKTLLKQGDQALSMRLSQMTSEEAALIVNLVRYENDNPGYVRETWGKITLRPFLTPTSGLEWQGSKEQMELQHTSFKEIIRKTDITEEFYYPSKQKIETVTTTYYSHIGVTRLPKKDSYILFANWDGFLKQYFQTAGKANEKLLEGKVAGSRLTKGQGNKTDDKEKMLESFRNFAPTLYKVLTDKNSNVKSVKDFQVNETTLNVMALTTTDLVQGADELFRTCLTICKEINSTNRLAVWRRYLRAVWLHS